MENGEQVPVTQTSILLKITVTTTARSKQQMRIEHITIQLTLKARLAKKPWTDETFSSYITLDDASMIEAAELDVIALLADTWDNDLDPEINAQLVQANVRAYLPFEGKSKGEGKFPVRSSHLPLSDRRQQLRELREK